MGFCEERLSRARRIVHDLLFLSYSTLAVSILTGRSNRRVRLSAPRRGEVSTSSRTGTVGYYEIWRLVSRPAE